MTSKPEDRPLAPPPEREAKLPATAAVHFANLLATVSNLLGVIKHKQWERLALKAEVTRAALDKIDSIMIQRICDAPVSEIVPPSAPSREAKLLTDLVTAWDDEPKTDDIPTVLWCRLYAVVEAARAIVGGGRSPAQGADQDSAEDMPMLETLPNGAIDFDTVALTVIEAWESRRYVHPSQRKAALQVAIKAALESVFDAGGWLDADTAPTTGFFMAWSPDRPDIPMTVSAEIFQRARQPGQPKHLSMNHFTKWRPFPQLPKVEGRS